MVCFTRLVSLPTLSKVSLVLIALYGQAFASAYALHNEYSVTEMGLAGAGGAAYAQDATTNYSNPAGLVNLKNPELVAGGTLIDGSAEFNGQACGGASTLGACNLTPVQDNGGTTAFVPEFSYGMPINDRLYAGISMTAPFGLSTDYSDDTALRYQATKSNLQTININPNIAFKFTDQFSVGAGIDAQQMSTVLNGYSNLSPNPTNVPITTPKGTFPGTIQYTDSQIKNNANDWGWGWDVGGLYQFSPGSRVGLMYRSAVQHDLKGTSKYYGGAGTASINGVGVVASQPYPTFETDTSIKIKLPAVTTASFYQDLNPQWALLGTVNYTQWSSVQNITLNDLAFINTNSTQLIAPSVARSSVNPQNFDNTWTYALGTEYKLTDAWTLRAGGSYDQSPVNNADRTIRLPDSNRWTGAVGAGYRVNQYFKVDGAYSHIWFQDAPINQPGSGSAQYVSSSIGNSDVSANLYSLQATIDIV
jgi:long-chain fatty acid transport protein